MNVILTKDKTRKEVVDYLHACCFSPTKQTFLQAIKNGNFLTWPSLTQDLVSKHLIPPVATAKGHLTQERKKLRSTKITQEHNEFFPTPETLPPARTNNVMALLSPFHERNTSYSDLTGRFPHISSRGNCYLLIVYDYDSNAILVEAIKSRAAAVIRDGWKKLNTILVNRGRQPELYILDNECSNELKSAMTKHKIDYQLVPPHVHCRNAVERAIQTFKHHFLSGLASVDPNYPVNEWDRLLPQTTLTLNLLRNSRVNTKLSAHAFLHGNFDFNSTPLAPPGTRALVHSKPMERNSRSFHGKYAWYVGPASEHYRCVKCYIPSTHSEVISDTVHFFPHSVPFPQCSTEDFFNKSALDKVTLLNQHKQYLSTLQSGDEISTAYHTIAKLLNRTDEKNPSSSQPNHSDPPVSTISPPVPIPPPRVENKNVPLPRVETEAVAPP